MSAYLFIGKGNELKYSLSIGSLSVLLSACATSMVMVTSMDDGEYVINQASFVGGVTLNDLKGVVYDEAITFCGGVDKAVKLVYLNIMEPDYGSPGNVEFVFRCI